MIWTLRFSWFGLSTDPVSLDLKGESNPNFDANVQASDHQIHLLVSVDFWIAIG
jgi:hypothetical protein